MATASTLPVVSVEEYLRTNYEPHCEYLDGVLVPKAVPDRIHSKLQKLLILMLAAEEQKFGLDGLPELHIRITSTRFRVPDVAAVRTLPADDPYPTDQTPPLFTIEIASLDEPWPVLRGKVTDHLAMGVSTVVIADPYNRTVMVATREQPLHELKAPLIVMISVPEAGVLQIDFDELYRKL
jgi:Uma2 family endonuclease